MYSLKNKGVSTAPTIIAIVFALIIASGGYIGITTYQKDRKDLRDQLTEIQGIITTQQIALQENRSNIIDLREEGGVNTANIQEKLVAERKAREETNAILKANLAAEQVARSDAEAVASADITDLENKLAEFSAADTAAVIATWQPRVATVACNFNGSISRGSGTIVQFRGNPIWVLTNRHVVKNTSGVAADSCTVTLPGTSFAETVGQGSISESAEGFDWAVIPLSNTPAFVQNLTVTSASACRQTPPIGGGVVVLGYPSIGARDQVTATEGIVAGFEGEYLITSAKVEQGNSGGAAVLLKENCLLGIPTFVQLGQVESLARILDINTVL